MKIIFLISMLTSSLTLARTCADYITDEWPDSRYSIETILTDVVVTDNVTNLMWKQCSEGLSGADCLTGTASSYSWKDALELTLVTNINVGFANYNDWRVPNIKELHSITATNCYEPAINEVAFPNTPIDKFWSSSPVFSFQSDSWVINFVYGEGIKNNRGNENFVRLVRSKY